MIYKSVLPDSTEFGIDTQKIMKSWNHTHIKVTYDKIFLNPWV